jgi:hypothetical protein
MRDNQGRDIGKSQYGVYAFYDYDSEPIYVGQSSEQLRVRIRRHLTNQRTDAVAMSVLDPFEVADIEMWPLFDLLEWKKSGAEGESRAKEYLDRAEYTVYRQAVEKSRFKAVLNEGVIIERPLVKLPKSHKGRIVPEELFENRRHADVRIARRASTIASLARVISERDVSLGLRRTLRTQAQRLEWLARHRLEEIDRVEREIEKEVADLDD